MLGLKWLAYTDCYPDTVHICHVLCRTPHVPRFILCKQKSKVLAQIFPKPSHGVRVSPPGKGSATEWGNLFLQQCHYYLNNQQCCFFRSIVKTRTFLRLIAVITYYYFFFFLRGRILFLKAFGAALTSTKAWNTQGQEGQASGSCLIAKRWFSKDAHRYYLPLMRILRVAMITARPLGRAAVK